MTATITRPAPLERTEHPHIVTSADTLGGEPWVEGTRIPARQILRMFESAMPAAEIVEEFPPLTLPQVHDRDEVAPGETVYTWETLPKRYDV